MRSDQLRLLGTVSLVLVTLASPAGAQVTEYEKTCEVSAAATLDERHFVVANDETGTLTVYDRARTEPVSRFELSPDITDIEGAARIGNTIFWLSSHSLTKKGHDKPERKLLLATAVADGPGLSAVGVPFADLRRTLAGALAMDEATLSKDLNIEGLAATPDGGLLIGLRGPRTPAGKAIVVRLDDPFRLVGLGRPTSLPAVKPGPTFVRELDLAGRGIRSMERVGDGARSYIVVADSEQDADPDPLLFWWDGDGEVAPGPKIGPLAGTVPEALVAWTQTQIQLFGDNGDRCTDKLKFKGRRYFPSQTIDLRK
ncbi:DUF3616 domain-containing protein [Methylobacterium nonmethylotrophicum]|uniref:DUF3616 domain-containing protein n=1 Tax=Methylobacterium nonmethylotrophicum TaxID=1141884 RepID=A0A4Z0NJ32_9HYPH|nr:DUF3616 domain-containing protein [Methylobacterium nonmethylotrophicum]TGD95693.1 DUF3616 domain-containing protein [Methylobacterium nonmethylotrophicum]